ncbi:36919_t:CDS:2, partial [Gigaspora margarita]
SHLVAQSLISDETVESYKWILECTKKAIGVEPLVFITDADPAMDSTIKRVYENTRSLHCIYHINQNLPKNLKAVLGNMYDQFIREFFHCCNTLDDTLFEVRWQELLQKFPFSASYLNRVLYPSCHAWACAFTSKIFTAKTLSSCIGIVSVGSEIFPAIDQKILEFLTLHILSVEHVEMAQCLYFNTIMTDLGIIDLNNEDKDNENIEDKFIEDVYDARQILLKSMVMEVNRDNIKEIWEIVDKKPGNHQQKHFEEKIDKLNIIFANMNAAQVQQSSITQAVPKPLIMPHSVSSSNRCAAIRRSKYSELWGLAQQATLLSVESDNSEMKQWLKAFIDRKKSSTTNNVNKNENEMSVDSENNLEVTNPPVTRHKGRRETKRYKSAKEKTYRQPYACRTCVQ